MKKIFIYFLFLSIIITSCTKPGIAPDQANSFAKFYGGSNLSEGFDVKQSTDGTIYALGYSKDTVKTKLYLVKADHFGNRLWTKYYDAVSINHGFSFQILPDGGLILMGNAIDNKSNSYIYLVRTKPNTNGDTLWTKNINYNSGIWGNDIQLTSDGGFVIAGGYNYSATINAMILFIDTDGKFTTPTIIPQDANHISEAKSIIAFKNGKYIIAGYTNYDSKGSSTIWIASKGAIIWSAFYLGGLYNADYRASLKMLPDSSLIYAGTLVENRIPQLILVKFKVHSDFDGIDSIYTKKNIDKNYTNSSNTNSSNIIVPNYSLEWISEDKFAIIGTFINPSDNSQSLYFLEVDGSGNRIISLIYGGTGNQRGNSICKTIDGGFITTGTIEYSSTVSSIFTLIKLKSDGGF